MFRLAFGCQGDAQDGSDDAGPFLKGLTGTPAATAISSVRPMHGLVYSPTSVDFRILELILHGVSSSFKDRQQEAEHDSQYLIMFCNYCMHINILYI